MDAMGAPGDKGNPMLLKEILHMAHVLLISGQAQSKLMETRMIRTLSLLAATLMGVGMLGISPANAATSYSWSFPDTSSVCTGQGTYSWGNSCTDNTPSTNPSLTVTGYSNTASGNTLDVAHVENYGGNLGVTNKGVPAQAYNINTSTNAPVGSLVSTGGNGSDAGEDLAQAPEHAMDNQTFVDSVLLSFAGASTPVALTSVSFGYVNGDGDFDLLRYTGSGTPILTGKTYDQLLTNGWSLVGQYSNSSATTVNVNTGLLTSGNKLNTVVTSSYWLVAADSSLLAGSAKDNVKDYFKLTTVAGTYTPPQQGGGVPEPGSLALLGLGTLLMVRARGKKPS